MKLELLNIKGEVFSEIDIYEDASPLELVRYFSNSDSNTELVWSMLKGYDNMFDLQNFYTKTVNGFMFIVSVQLGGIRKHFSKVITKEYVLSGGTPKMALESICPYLGFAIQDFVMDRCVVKELGE